MPDPITATIGGGAMLGGSIYQGEQASDAAKDASKATQETAARAEALNRERFALAQGYLDPYVGRANIAAQQLQAELGLPQYNPSTGPNPVAGRITEIDDEISRLESARGNVNPLSLLHNNDGGGLSRAVGGVLIANTANKGERYAELIRERDSLQSQISNKSPYIDQSVNQYKPRSMSEIPGFQAVMDESLGAAEQSAINSGSTLYGGRRLKAAGEVGAGVQQSYYNNYMNLLQNMANPTAATNLAGMGVGQGQSIGQQNIAATGMSNDYRMQGVAAKNAAISDVMGGAVQLGTGYMMGGGLTPPPQQVWV